MEPTSLSVSLHTLLPEWVNPFLPFRLLLHFVKTKQQNHIPIKRAEAPYRGLSRERHPPRYSNPPWCHCWRKHRSLHSEKTTINTPKNQGKKKSIEPSEKGRERRGTGESGAQGHCVKKPRPRGHMRRLPKRDGGGAEATVRSEVDGSHSHQFFSLSKLSLFALSFAKSRKERCWCW